MQSSPTRKTDMGALDPHKKCELHVHSGGCLYADDLLDLGRQVYEQVDWRLFVDSYEQAFGVRPDPLVLFREALDSSPGGLDRFRQHYVFSQEDGADFGRFQAKFNLLICLWRHWWQVLQRQEDLFRRIVARHRAEGLEYVEYRAMYATDDVDGFLNFHRLHARAAREASGGGFQVRYIVSLPRWAPLEGYALVQRLFDENPELVPYVVGLDFCFVEEGYPPQTLAPLCARLEQDAQARPERALDVVYHVGETYFDKSLESAVRWCHQAALLGARRLGHAIALGLDPRAAVARRPQAHEQEPVSERLAQIDYDLEHESGLAGHGVDVDAEALQRESEVLGQRPPQGAVHRPYTVERLEEVRRRQDFVLDELARLGTAIECCPTSNLRLGGVPDPAAHPVHRFLASRVDLAIAADDPGIFDSPLAAEVEWVASHSGLTPRALARRLGDPRRLRLGQRRAV